MLSVIGRARALVATTVLTSLCASFEARAQDVGARNTLPLERYRIAVDNTGFGTTEGGGIPDHLEFQLGYVGNYTLNPLVLQNPTNARESAIVAHRVAGSFVATIGFFDYVALGIDVPMTHLQLPGTDVPDELREPLGLDQGVAALGMGDMKVVPKIRILRDDRHFVSLAIIPAFTLPTAGGLNFTNGVQFDYGGSYLGEGPLSFSFLPEIALSTNLYGFRAATNLQWRLRPQFQYLGIIPVGPDISYRLGVGYDFGFIFKRYDIPVPGLMVYGELFGATSDRNPFGLIQDPTLDEREQAIRSQEIDLANALEWSAGVRYHAWRGIHLEAAIGTGIVNGYGSPDVRVTGGIRYAFEVTDKDGDGLDDDKDACPEQAEDKDSFEDSDGCPDLDNDQDGLPDDVDACPNEAEDVDGFEDTDGCPDEDNDKDGLKDATDRCPDEAGSVENEGCPITDRDKDGIPDAEDLCPDEPGLADRQGCPIRDRDKDGVEDDADKCPDEPGPPARQGCPIPDKDGDGVEDKDDQCPDEPGPAVLKGCPDKDGDGVADKNDKCPESAGLAMFEGCGDKDKDGIPDHTDKCPEEPETINGVNDEDGCPDKGKVVVVVTKEKIEIKETVFFDTGKASIQKRSFNLLDQVSLVLKANNQIKKVSVQGHTDDQGNDEFNKKLSQERADSVKAYLIGKGVDPARIESVGFGESKPIADNKTASGRSQNRRVEFVILEQE